MHTQTQVDDMIQKGLTPFRQDVVGDNSIEITASTEERYAINGNSRNVSSGPSYMTDRWDVSEYKIAATSEYDSPTYQAELGFVWTPDASNTGDMTIRVYIDDDTPKLIRTYVTSYKGAGGTPMNFPVSWYWGSETGYDAKNDGVYFTVECEHSGDITTPSAIITNLQ